MADLKQVRVQLLNAQTGAPLADVDTKTSDAAVFLKDGSTLRSYLEAADDARSELQRDLAAHLATTHVTPDKVAALLVGVPAYNKATGAFTYTKHDGTTETIDTLLEQVVTNWEVREGKGADASATLADGRPDDPTKIYLDLVKGEPGSETRQSVDLSQLIDIYTGSEGTIIVTVDNDNKIHASVANDAITMANLAEDVKNAIQAAADNYKLPAATTSTLGGVIVGDGLSVEANGKLSAANIKYNGEAVKLDMTPVEDTVVIKASCASASVITTAVGSKVAAGITVSAALEGSAAGSATVAYQWYKKVVGTDIAASAIAGATSATLGQDNIDVATAGTTIYYAVISATGTGVVVDPVTTKRVTVVVG